MLEGFFPNMVVDSVEDIPYGRLMEKHIRGIMFDIDNTLAPYDVAEPPDEMIRLMTRLKSMGFQVCLLSNGSKKRVLRFNEKLGLTVVFRANKPLTGAVRSAMRKMGTDRDNTVIVGDQIFTDIWCGNRLRMLTILVKPICDRDEWITRVKRKWEKKVLEVYERQVARP